MADEIKIRLTMTVENGTFKTTISPAQVDVDQSAIGCGGYVQSIGTSEEVVNFGDVALAGYAFLQNVDATNWVEYGPENAGAMVSFGKLKPGEIAVLRIKPGVVMRAKANAAAVKLDVRLFED